KTLTIFVCHVRQYLNSVVVPVVQPVIIHYPVGHPHEVIGGFHCDPPQGLWGEGAHTVVGEVLGVFGVEVPCLRERCTYGPMYLGVPLPILGLVPCGSYSFLTQ